MKLLPLIILILFIIPLPIKIKFIYINNKISIFLFNKKINLEKKDIKKKEKAIKEKNSIDYLSIFQTLKDNRFKPTLKLDLELEIGTSDAAYTALLYGSTWTLLSFVYRILICIFNIKKFNPNVTPDFNNKKLNVLIKSILFISLVKVIYIAYMVNKNQKRSGNYG